MTNKREVNMTEYWPISEESWGKLKQQNKELGQYPVILTEQAWSIKDLLYGGRHYFVLQDRRGKSRASKMAGTISPAQIANQNSGFFSRRPLADSTIW